MIRKYIYLFGIWSINKQIFINYDFLLKSQFEEIEIIKDYQLKKLKELVDNAYNKSTYYREKFDKHSFHPNDLTSLNDLQRIPFLTKEDILNNINRIQISNLHEKLVYSETSGSTGKPIIFYRNKDWDAWHRASVFRGYSWHGIRPWEKNGYFWGYNFSIKKRSKVALLDYLQNQFRIFSYNTSELKRFIGKLKKAKYLEGYSSAIYEVAKMINENNIDTSQFNLEMIKGTSEKIFDKYQEEVQQAFGKKMISEYGAAEAGIIAFECPQGNMHINMETVIIEEINSEIIVTNLVSKSFPIIRYKLGDYVVIDQDTKCKCGMKHFIIKEIMGRVGKVIYGLMHQYPSLTLYYVFKNLAMEQKLILNYQAIQRNKGVIVISIEQNINENEKNLLIKEAEKYFKNDLTLVIEVGIDLSVHSKKKVDFISEIGI